MDTESAAVERYAMSTCSYEASELGDLLGEISFERVEVHTSVAAGEGGATPDLFGLTASRELDAA